MKYVEELRDMNEIIIFFILLFSVNIVLPILVKILKRKHRSGYKRKVNGKQEKKIARKGRIGEQRIRKRLSVFLKDGAEILYNCYIPSDKNGTSEIDVLLITKKGIWVIESKNYSGWIFGKSGDYMWTQSLRGRNGKAKKSTFYNPIAQNRGHIKYLKKYLGINVPYISLVVFSDKCVFKNLEINTEDVEVIHLNELQYCILKKMENMHDILAEDVIQQLRQKLYLTTQVSDEIKKNHVQDILDKKYSEKVSIDEKDNMNIDSESQMEEVDSKLSDLHVAKAYDIDISQKEIECNKENDTNQKPFSVEISDTSAQTCVIESERKQVDSTQKEKVQQTLPIKRETPKNMKITYCPQCHATMIPKIIERDGEPISILECYRYPKCKYREELGDTI